MITSHKYLSSLRFRLNFSTVQLVIMRHGETKRNQIKQWSGWHDSSISQQGQFQALQAAKILKQQKLHFDGAYCSMLSRSIKSLNIMLDQMDLLYIPVKKRWQLNQKFYGALQGVDKLKMVEKYGKEMVGQWRRSYTISPLKLFPEDPRHPAQDHKYRHIDPAILPSTQNLTDVLVRVTDIYQTQIKPQLVDNKRLLIVCHGSTIRALTRLLLAFSEQESSKFSIPNSIPILIQLQKSNLKLVNWRHLGQQSNIKDRIKSVEQELTKR